MKNSIQPEAGSSIPTTLTLLQIGKCLFFHLVGQRLAFLEKQGFQNRDKSKVFSIFGLPVPPRLPPIPRIKIGKFSKKRVFPTTELAAELVLVMIFFKLASTRNLELWNPKFVNFYRNCGFLDLSGITRKDITWLLFQKLPSFKVIMNFGWRVKPVGSKDFEFECRDFSV